MGGTVITSRITHLPEVSLLWTLGEKCWFRLLAIFKVLSSAIWWWGQQKSSLHHAPLWYYFSRISNLFNFSEFEVIRLKIKTKDIEMIHSWILTLYHTSKVGILIDEKKDLRKFFEERNWPREQGEEEGGLDGGRVGKRAFESRKGKKEIIFPPFFQWIDWGGWSKDWVII